MANLPPASSSTPALTIQSDDSTVAEKRIGPAPMDDGATLEAVRTEKAAAGDHMGTVEKQETVLSVHHPRSFPDGGLQAWLCVFGGFCCLFCSFGWINCIGIFQGYYQQNQLRDYSPSQVSWISSLEAFCMFVGGAVIGKIFDSYGPRWILAAGTLLHVFGLMMASLSSKYWHFVLAQGIVSAVGASLCFYPAVGCVSTWFHARRAFALGIVASGSSLGGVIFPIMIRRLIPRIGFGWTMRSTAFLILALMLVANATVSSRLPPRGPTPWRLSDFTRHFRELPFALTVFASFLFFFGMFLPFNYLPVYAQSHGMSASLANYLVAILNGVSVFGRIIPGYIGDKVGRFNTMAVIATASGILVLALWLPSSGNAATIVFAALYGFTTGAFVSIAPALIAQISDIREIGLRSGALFATVSLGALTGSPIGGALVDRYDGGYKGLQIFAGVCLMGGAVMFTAVRMLLSKGKINVIV
ncbi:major facilitator superfamily domain-containing protein [Geopyxis carbonaria]|nr:major facilitator superfamily domain-containing protein [Geopyxis carbonaria]